MAKIYNYILKNPRVTSNYGYRIHPIYKVKKFHDGIDLNSKSGDRNLCAIEDGYVLSITTGKDKATTGYGNKIWIRYPRLGIALMYAHCKKILKKKGDKVKKGDVVAIMGSTGASTGVHLHLGMQPIGKSNWLNPYTYNYTAPTTKYNLTRLLKKGSKGEDVKKLQKIVGTTADGIFGNNTLAKVKAFQKKNNLTQDGIVGKNTAHALGWLYQGK